MPGNYEAYHKMTQRDREIMSENALKMEELKKIKARQKMDAMFKNKFQSLISKKQQM